jgi:Tubulin-tyrosine ligase family
MFEYEKIKALVSPKSNFGFFTTHGYGKNSKLPNFNKENSSEDEDDDDSSSVMNQFELEDESKKWIVQRYMTNPLLYQERKFDIRSFVLLTTVHSRVKVYWFNDAYVRTSS